MFEKFESSLLKLFFVVFFIASNNSFAQESEDSSVPEAKCQGGRFKPCICAPEVPKEFTYVPALAECRNRAAIITRGKFLNIFSVVVRDRQNRDRFGTPNFGGCSSRLANSVSPPNRCSAFKTQSEFFREVDGNTEKVHCLGASGTSRLFRDVVRITAKIKDVPTSNQDPLLRLCLASPRSQLN